MKYVLILLMIALGYVLLNPISLPGRSFSLLEDASLVLKFKANKYPAAFLRRIAGDRVLFTFLKEGESPVVDRNGEESFNSAKNISVLNGDCVLNFSEGFSGVISCSGKEPLEFSVFRDRVVASKLVHEDSEDLNVGELLAKMEDLSDHILRKNIEIEEGRSLLASIKEGGLLRSGSGSSSGKSKVDSGLSRVNRMNLLRSSIAGQEILLSSRLLEEEARVVLSLRPYEPIAPKASGELVPSEIGQGEAGGNSSQNEGQWWKGLE